MHERQGGFFEARLRGLSRVNNRCNIGLARISEGEGGTVVSQGGGGGASDFGSVVFVVFWLPNAFLHA